ncbi:MULTISPECIES: hypothetical protein [Fulvivirga]|uniref:Uncharacterized protein n=1 Tax=Fulvivirga sediminis TaxID=2803949 RepID=A0A937FB83_9BACT|nr:MULTISPECIES: hypothetical protein [Fulvivirga]MBL3657288.1 hypothetical protein [Fulvivirga sediminis]UII25905.1 hypothetical protein LVD15_21790 [Fulvivirga maritima]
MNYISELELREFLNDKNNRFTNLSGMQIGWSEETGIWTFLMHQSYDQGPYEVSIATEYDSLTDFITGFKLYNVSEIDHLNYTSSWMRYLNGEAEIIIAPMELEASLSFKILKLKTIIFSLELHFYDEEYEHLTMPEDFERYILKKESLLRVATQMRYK